MGMKTTVVWECERCPSTVSTDPGDVPVGWRGFALSDPLVDGEDGRLDYTMVRASQFTLLCSDCIDEVDDFMYGGRIDSLPMPRKVKNTEAPKTEEETVADLERTGIVSSKPGSPGTVAINKSAVDMKLPTTITPDVPVVGEAQVESDG